MNKKECDIIKDLLPSYVDNICSEASNEWIKAHLVECRECRAIAEALKTTEFSAKRLDFAQVDATKKVKKRQVGNSIVMLGLCMFLMLMTTAVFAEGNSVVSHMVLYAELPVCMVITWFVNKGRQARRTWDKWDTISLAAVLFVITYGISEMWFVVLKTLGGKTILGLELNEIGPFLAFQMVGCAVVCLIIYMIQMIRLYRRGSVNSVILSLCLLGIFLMLVYRVYLGNLSDVESAVMQLKKSTCIMLTIGLVGMAVLAFIDKRNSKC